MKDDVDFSRYIMARIDLRKIWLLSCFPSRTRAYTLSSAVFGLVGGSRFVWLLCGLDPYRSDHSSQNKKVNVSVPFAAI